MISDGVTHFVLKKGGVNDAWKVWGCGWWLAVDGGGDRWLSWWPKGGGSWQNHPTVAAKWEGQPQREEREERIASLCSCGRKKNDLHAYLKYLVDIYILLLPCLIYLA